jgi:hypothetical protein
MIFRWSTWGKQISENIELLRYSINSFRKQFGDGHQYVVYTDNPSLVTSHVDSHVEVREFPADSGSQFCVTSKATWLKWCPAARLDVDQDEFFVDSDVFLLKYPRELDAILSNPKMKFAIMDEFLGQPYQHGAMRRKATPDTPFVNAGLFLQKAGSDISMDLTREFEWWQEHIPTAEQTHHDEQGALAIALTRYFVAGELYILPKEKYAIISETSNTGIESLDGITLFHATYPTHPAFYRFKGVLDELLSA